MHIFGTLLHFGWTGVSLFFVLSGFLISGILWDGFQKPNWWRRFYVRRSLRIFPVYYLALLIAAVVWLLSGYSLAQISPLLYYVFYLGNIPALAPYFHLVPQSIQLVHLWSLAVEEQFYILWPFLLVLFARKRRGAMHLILALWTLSLLFRVTMIYFQTTMEWRGEFLPSRAGELLAGAYLAMMVRGDTQERQRLFRWLPAILIGSAVLVVAICFVTGGASFETPLMSTVGLCCCSTLFASMIGLALRPGILQTIFALPVLRWLGKISYGVYVYHMLLRTFWIWIADQIAYRVYPGIGYEGRLALIFFVALAGTLAIASLSFYTFESAFLRLKDRLPR